MKRWLQQHRQALVQTLRRMGRNQLATAMVMLVIGITLSLPALLYLTVENLAPMRQELTASPQINLYLTLDITPDNIARIAEQLDQHPQIQHARFVPREAAWKDLQAAAGLQELATALEQNPLPDAFIVEARAHDPAALDHLAQALAHLPGVQEAKLDADWVKRLHGLLTLAREGITLLSLLLGFALLAIVGNTIRLQILTQREEIEVSQLIGATPAFIRRPFLYAGAFYGGLGGLIAWGLTAACGAWLNDTLAGLALSLSPNFAWRPLDNQDIFLLVCGSALLGWAGAYGAVSRYLIRPLSR